MFEGSHNKAAPAKETNVPPAKGADRRKGSGKSKSGFWKRQARTWHWVSGAVCLIGMLLFSFTGITLNHAAEISADPVIEERSFTLEAAHTDLLAPMPESGVTDSLPSDIVSEIKAAINVSVANRQVEWTDVDAYIALPRPGGDAWLSVDRTTGEVVYELTTRGAVSYLNDLHKGRNTGRAWSWFIDIFSVASILFCLTGLWLLQIHAGKRRSTWPTTLLGLAVPVVLAVFFIH